jgi:hypothetical protein
MPTYPRDQDKLYTWAQVHAQAWAQDPSAVGLSVEQVEQLAQVVEQFGQARVAARAARAAARSATQASIDAKLAMRNATSDLVKVIRAYAATSGDAEVLNRALLPAIAAGSPVAPPGQPTRFNVGLNPDGSLTIQWKAKHPAGSDRVVYLVQRQLPGEDGWTLLGASGEKSFVDETLPQGVVSATYRVTAQRGRVKGEASIPIVVSFGSVAMNGAADGAGNSGAMGAGGVRIATRAA